MHKKKKVLIFEDFEKIRSILTHHFKSKNYDVFIATSLSEALSYLNGTNIDLVVADNDIKNNAAIRIIKHLRESTSYLFTPIILLISGTKDQYIEETGDYNIAMYLSKPVDMTILSNVTNRIS